MSVAPIPDRNAAAPAGPPTLKALASAFLRKGKVAGDIAVLMVPLLVVELALTGPASLADVSPHPFWIPVLLVSVQHGSRGGLLAAIVAAAFAVLWVHPERSSLEDFYAYTSRLFVEPVLWIAAALILGQMRDRHIAENATLDDRAAELQADRNMIGEHCLALRRRIAELERQASLADVGSAEEALERLKALNEARPEQALSRLAAAASALLGPCVLSLYRVVDFEVTAETISCGLEAKRPERRPRHIRALVRAMHYEPRVLSFLVPGEAEVLKGALVAVPLRVDGSREPAGVLCCEALDTTQPELESRLAIAGTAMETLAMALTRALRPERPRYGKRPRYLNANAA